MSYIPDPTLMMFDTELKGLWIPAYHPGRGSNYSAKADWLPYMQGIQDLCTSEYQKASDHLVLMFNPAGAVGTLEMSLCYSHRFITNFRVAFFSEWFLVLQWSLGKIPLAFKAKLQDFKKLKFQFLITLYLQNRKISSGSIKCHILTSAGFLSCTNGFNQQRGDENFSRSSKTFVYHILTERNS